MKEEVTRLLTVNFIKEPQFATWLANVVMVPKPNKKWLMCVDFTDLNKACPKDCYLLPRIDALIDATLGFKILSFLDAFARYHQIKLAEEDQIHTSFRTAGGIYCYTVMPFGLKNAGATYQCMVKKIFAE